MGREASAERVEQWRDMVGRWRESGLSGSAFVRQEGLREWQFRYWAKRIAALEGEGDGPAFARVTTVGSGLSVTLPGGLRLELEPGFDEGTLRRFLNAACSPC